LVYLNFKLCFNKLMIRSVQFTKLIIITLVLFDDGFLAVFSRLTLILLFLFQLFANKKRYETELDRIRREHGAEHTKLDSQVYVFFYSILVL